MKRSIALLVLFGASALAVGAQPRPVDTAASVNPARRTAPESFEAKYQGGLFGFTEKEEGILKFDDANQRLVFLDKNKKERFHLPYKSLMTIYPQSQTVNSTAGSVIRHIPLPGAGLAGFMREKRRYLVMHFADPDVEEARGVINFKLDNKELLDSVIYTLGEKAKLVPRGDAYYRPRPKDVI